MREINTYLASELFHHFTVVRGHSPRDADVDALAASALGSADGYNSDVYDALLREIRKDAEGDFTAFQGDWKMIAMQGNKALVRNYSDQRAKQAGIIATNEQHLSSGTNDGSLLQRIERKLMEAVRDIDRGPMYAHRMLDAATGHNLLNVIDGYLATNERRWNHELAQDELRKSDYENARLDFEAHQSSFTGFGNKDRFERYEWYLRQFYAHKLDIDAYEALDRTLRTLRKQLSQRDTSYYLKLVSVMGNLADTFEENRRALQSQATVLRNTGGFEEPLMSVAELKGALDEEVARVDVPNMLSAFMELFADNEGEWAAEDEARIARLVNGFFVGRAFSGFAGRTITRFLQDKYGTTNDDRLTQQVYRDWMLKLTEKASPLFHFDPAVWDQSKTSRIAFVSVPTASGPIRAAAKQMHDVQNLWDVKESDLTDRIYVMCSAAVLPLASYTKCTEYEEAYFTDGEPGRHYYEGGIEGMPMSDWRKLPSLTPQSLIDTSRVPHTLAKLVEEGRSLFEDAMAFGVLDDDGNILVPDAQSMAEVRQLLTASREQAANMTSKAQVPAAEELLQSLDTRGKVRLIPSGKKVFTDGNTEPDFKRRNMEDHFVSSPALHALVRESVDAIKPIDGEVKAAQKSLQEAIDRVSNPDLDNFFDALFSGVITINGFQASFERDEFGIKTRELLTARDRQTYPFCSIPPYQAFLSYSALPLEDKQSLTDRANKRFNEQYDEVAALAQKLTSEFAENKIQAWAGYARTQSNRSELMAFLGELKQRFDRHKLEFGI